MKILKKIGLAGILAASTVNPVYGDEAEEFFMGAALRGLGFIEDTPESHAAAGILSESAESWAEHERRMREAEAGRSQVNVNINPGNSNSSGPRINSPNREIPGFARMRIAVDKGFYTGIIFDSNRNGIADDHDESNETNVFNARDKIFLQYSIPVLHPCYIRFVDLDNGKIMAISVPRRPESYNPNLMQEGMVYFDQGFLNAEQMTTLAPSMTGKLNLRIETVDTKTEQTTGFRDIMITYDPAPKIEQREKARTELFVCSEVKDINGNGRIDYPDELVDKDKRSYKVGENFTFGVASEIQQRGDITYNLINSSGESMDATQVYANLHPGWNVFVYREGVIENDPTIIGKFTLEAKVDEKDGGKIEFEVGK